MKRVRAMLLFLALIVLGAARTALGQNPVSYLNDPGGPVYSVQIPVENGYIDVSNGNLHLEFSLAGPPQRGALTLGRVHTSAGLR